MTNQEHPIVPSKGLKEEWESEWHHYRGQDTYEEFMAKQAAQWGADQELKACCDWLLLEGWHPDHPNKLRAARRPKPLSEADLALAALERAPKAGAPIVGMDVEQYDIVCRAINRLKELEALPND